MIQREVLHKLIHPFRASIERADSNYIVPLTIYTKKLHLLPAILDIEIESTRGDPWSGKH